MESSSFVSTLRKLKESEVEFIVVGGLAAVLNGAPIQTYDINLAYSQHRENIERLLRILGDLGAFFRIQPERYLRPDRSHLSGGGHLNLITASGPVDLLGSIGAGLKYDDLLPHSTEMEIGGGISIRVLNLEMLIRLKEELGGAKDVAALPVLRQTLREFKKKN